MKCSGSATVLAGLPDAGLLPAGLRTTQNLKVGRVQQPGRRRSEDQKALTRGAATEPHLVPRRGIRRLTMSTSIASRGVRRMVGPVWYGRYHRVMPPQPRELHSGFRWLAGVIGFAAGIWLAVELNHLAERAEPWAGWRRALHEDGYVILALYAGWLMAGAVLQTAPALMRRARVGSGWLAVLGLLSYGVLVAALAWLIAPASPQFEYVPGSRRGSPTALYGTFLAFVLFGYAMLRCRVRCSSAVTAPAAAPSRRMRTMVRPRRRPARQPTTPARRGSVSCSGSPHCSAGWAA